ncbi:MAG: hypothetical protein ACRDN6_14580 [Gaiellaceae bacterium]
MTRFLHWRKMTWAILLWSGAMLTWLIGSVAFASAKDCATDFGATSGFLTKQACLDASSGGSGLGVLLISSLWFLGVVVLSLIWFTTRPLWRQGHGARLRRLRSVEIPWVPRHLT